MDVWLIAGGAAVIVAVLLLLLAALRRRRTGGWEEIPQTDLPQPVQADLPATAAPATDALGELDPGQSGPEPRWGARRDRPFAHARRKKDADTIETVAIPMDISSCHFFVGQTSASPIFATRDDLRSAVRGYGAICSDEASRLKVLIDQTTMPMLVGDFQKHPGQVRYVLCARSDDARLSMYDLPRGTSEQRSILALSRMIPAGSHYTKADLERDVDSLIRLSELLARPLPVTDTRASVPKA